MIYLTVFVGLLGPSQYKDFVLPVKKIPMLKIKQSCDRLIFNMGIPIPRKAGLYIETGPRVLVIGRSVH